MSNSAFRIDVLGTSFTISADADADYLESLLEQYKQQIEDTKLLIGVTDPLKLAILSGFLLCDEIEKSKRAGQTSTINLSDSLGDTSQGDISPEVEKLTLEMISKIDEALNKT
jgi:cell division protein ZapA (FtsZ GTPase activity inhibitor)